MSSKEIYNIVKLVPKPGKFNEVPTYIYLTKVTDINIKTLTNKKTNQIQGRRSIQNSLQIRPGKRTQDPDLLCASAAGVRGICPC